MSSEILAAFDLVWLETHPALSLPELAALSGLSAMEVDYLLECEALLPTAATGRAAEPAAEPVCFDAQSLILARAAARLRDDFELDANGVALALHLLKRIHQLEAELRAVRAQLPG